MGDSESISIEEAQSRTEQHSQSHVLAHWERLSPAQRENLAQQVLNIDFSLLNRLVDRWITNPQPPENFDSIAPAPVLPRATADSSRTETFEAGEEALRSGRIGLVLVAGGQGTRLGYSGPKGAYPIGPISGRSLFAYHAEKIHNLQTRYDCTLPWFIMVGESNEDATKTFFREHGYFGLREEDVFFFKQRMVPSVDAEGKLLLEDRDRIAMNPNGHGGCIPALVESGLLAEARGRGIDTLSYFQVDNWAVKVADPYFIGHHVLGNSEMSSKVHRKSAPRESFGVFCLCDGVLRVIEYTELDRYPQLLETDGNGKLLHFAGNTAIHVFDLGFIERLGGNFQSFPWHCSYKKVPYLDENGTLVKPESENGHKFETFVFDALRYVSRPPVVLEILREGEYTPIKQFSGANSVEAARESMNAHWAGWIEAAGGRVARGGDRNVAV
ncbi:MAG: UTP--glucose-1-phosphate uridylyltransferase, partial [Candidatus Hydrogenedentes bacterium]|nr:UTP--glucose-1-phosphate uridylyltransferase [Candidatus Hydrogenedentota bacterium]